MSTLSLSGLHHVTAITADGQANLDFYCGFLGLRLVKITVNFDDPRSYHLYYGDELGRPGSIMTFFTWPRGQSGHIGPPQVTVTSFAAPAGSVDYWLQRLKSHKIPFTPPVRRFGEEVIAFADPDGIALEIIFTDKPGGHPWNNGTIPLEHAIRGFYGVTIAEEGHERTSRLLTDHMGYTLKHREDNRFRYRTTNDDGLATAVDVLCVPEARRGRRGTGVIHHVAFRIADQAQQQKWLDKVVKLGYNSSPIMDRNYFQSIYFREPGGVLFELATDAPGFTADEEPAHLGTALKLPAQYEPHRQQIEQALPPLVFPNRK